MTREAYASIYAAARDDLPCARRAYHAPEDALVTVMHAGPHEETTTSALNRALTWSEYHDEYRAALARRREAERLARLAEEEAARLAEEEEYARLAAEESSLAALSPTARRAREEANEEAREEARRLAEEEARRLAEEEDAERDAAQEEAADWAWDGSDATELEAERLAEEEAANAPPPLVPMPATAYDVEAATSAFEGATARAYPPNGATVTIGPDGAPTVAFGGTRVGVRGASVVATFGNDSGASVVVARAPRRPRTGTRVRTRGGRERRTDSRRGREPHVQTRTRRERRADSRRRRRPEMDGEEAGARARVARGRRARVGRGGKPDVRAGARARARAA